MKTLGKMTTPWDIMLRTSRLRPSNCEVLLDTSSNTIFYCKFGLIACDGSSKDATVSIVARI